MRVLATKENNDGVNFIHVSIHVERLNRDLETHLIFSKVG